MTGFICPVCQSGLTETENGFVCSNGHSFDKAKSGYVNLLVRANKGVKNHGDNKLMARGRRDFLNKGYYEPLQAAICEAAFKYAEEDAAVLDCGCGECYYTGALSDTLREKNGRVFGVDISKVILDMGAKRKKNISLAVASAFNLPFAGNSVDMLLNVFAPLCLPEYKRVLKRGGILLLAIPLENHLMGLKKAVYDEPYQNEVADFAIDGFTLLENREIRYTMELKTNEDILNLFSMTPYYYKTGAENQKRLERLACLTTEAEFGLLIYKKD